MNEKWWGWGDLNKSFNLKDKPYFIPFLEDIFERKLLIDNKPVSIDSISLPPVRLNDEFISKIENIVDKKNCQTSKIDRLYHCYGKSYKDLVRIRKGIIETCPDAVVYPRNNDEIIKILNVANENNIIVVPFGGGTSVVGGLEVGINKPYIVLDLSRNMNKIINLDKDSLLATFQAGIKGPEIERILNESGFTLSHYPQSFEFSTLGGWVATRSAGQQSTKYGKIEKMVNSLKMIYINGEIETKKLPMKATGPDLENILIGSEGIFGIITEVTVKIHYLPEKKDYRAYLFENFQSGINFIQDLIQKHEIYPAMIRLSDETETKLLFKLSEKKNLIRKITSSFISNYIKNVKKFETENSALMLIGLEGSKTDVDNKNNIISKILENYKHLKLGKSIGDKWYKTRFDLPYLRDSLMDMSIMVDTLETSTIWSNIENLYFSVRNSINKGIEEVSKKGLVACHISHVYHEGASLYYTFASPMKKGYELEQWKIIKNYATDAIANNNGSISHHHGIGSDHSKWLKKQIDIEGINIIKSLKNHFDPNAILNPQNIL
ncbi:MAG: alkylglycerone-phosphate synthase [Candidatus Sericytochromatia bacterium]|nr:MAG: alkylglycerone-phosphate synthase [Candidatus Sericytochromatia bacterium]